MQFDMNAALWKGLLGSIPTLLKICWPVVVFFVVVEGVRLYLAIRERKLLAASGIADIDSMDGQTFEKRLEVLFESLGYRVERTPYGGDWGADLVVQREGIKTVVQAKRYNKKVGVRAIQEAVAAKPKYICTAAMVVTNSRFTNQARELARVNNVDLWDRERLVSALLQAGKANAPQPRTRSSVEGNTAPASLPTAGEVCAGCGKPLSPKVAQYCRDNSARFAEKLLCFDHQKRAAKAVASR